MASPSLMRKRLLFFKLWRDMEGQDGALDLALKEAAQKRATDKHDQPWLHDLLQRMETRWREQGILPRRPKSLYALFGAFPFSGLLLLLFACGALSFYFGSGRDLHLLANPFMALLAWHLTLYVVRLIGAVRKTQSGWFTEWLEHTFERMAQKQAEQTGPVTWQRVRARFRVNWLRYAHRASLAEIYTKLHGCSLALTFGMIAGLYLNGLLRAYRFTWDSTFIQDPALVEQALTVLFWPLQNLRALLGAEGLPPLAGANGAAWIHFYAQAAFLYIVVPRLVMLALALSQSKPTEAEFQALLTHAKLDQWAHFLAGTKARVQFIGYSFHMSQNVLAKAQTVIETHLENDVVAEYSFLEWGAEADEIPWPEQDAQVVPWWLAICCNAAQTPEDEIHGELFRGISAHPIGAQGRVILMLDCAKLDPQKRQKRVSDWRSIVETYKLEAVLDVQLTDLAQVGT